MYKIIELQYRWRLIKPIQLAAVPLHTALGAVVSAVTIAAVAVGLVCAHASAVGWISVVEFCRMLAFCRMIPPAIAVGLVALLLCL